MLDRVLAVEDRHREQDRAELPDAEEDRGSLGRRRQHHGDAVTALDAVIGERVRRLVREILELAPGQLPRRAVEALPDHRRLVARMLVADVGGDVVALRHLPTVRGAYLLVARGAHPRPSLPGHAEALRRGQGGLSPGTRARCSRRPGSVVPASSRLRPRTRALPRAGRERHTAPVPRNRSIGHRAPAPRTPLRNGPRRRAAFAPRAARRVGADHSLPATGRRAPPGYRLHPV